MAETDPSGIPSSTLASIGALVVGLFVAVLVAIGLIDEDGDIVVPPPDTTTTTTTVPSTTSTTTTAPPTTTVPSTTTVPPGGDNTVGGDGWAEVQPLSQHLRTLNDPSSDGQGGAFRFFCNPSHFAQVDSIVDPGNPNTAHNHLFFGNTGTDENSTYASLTDTGDGTCMGGPLNRTAYWVPALVNSQGNPVVPSEIEVYYKSRNPNVQAFPPGLRMISDQGSIDGNRMVVEFPHCWDGVNLDSPDHRSHLDEPGFLGDTVSCPAEFPVPIPRTRYILTYPTSDLRLPPGAHNVHGDWFGAWEPGIQDRWVTECLQPQLSCAFGRIGSGPDNALRHQDNYPGSLG